MTCYRIAGRRTRHAVRIERWGDVPAGPVASPRPRAGDPRHHARVRITRAAIGVTDLMAIAGDYLLQPRTGLIPGYDFISVVESVPPRWRDRLAPGQRVAGILPHMGAHTDILDVPPSILVPIPHSVADDVAATALLDGTTATLALNSLPQDQGTLLVQGAGGAVGSWATQLAHRQRWTVYGTGSARSFARGEKLGATMLDYREPTWPQTLLAMTGGGVRAAIDHTGSDAVRSVVVPNGRIVRTAFKGVPGRGRRTTAMGATAALLRSFSRPAERVCSVPLTVATRRATYRAALSSVLRGIEEGSLEAPAPLVFPAAEYRSAVAAAQQVAPGYKVILAFDG